MGQYIVKAEMCIINSVDLSDHLIEGTLTYEADMVDQTAMTIATKANAAGLLSWQMDFTFLQDYSSGKTDATIFPLVGATFFLTEVRPVNTSRSATNPAYTGNGVISSYNPIAGKVGDNAVAKVTIKCAGTLNRLTA